MKIKLIVYTILCSASLAANVSPIPVVDGKAGSYEVVSRDAHSSTWQKVTLDEAGLTNVASYVELATGLNFWNPATQQWEESKEQFCVTKEGYAVATNGQHRLILAPDIATAGAVDLLNADGVRLVSSPMGLSFADSVSGKNVLIAQVTNCLGELATENSVVYGRAYDSVRAAIRLTYTRSGFESDVILYQQLPSPAEWASTLRPQESKYGRRF